MPAVFSKDGYVDLIYIEGGEVCASIGKMAESSTVQVSTGKQVHLRKTNLVSGKEIMNTEQSQELGFNNHDIRKRNNELASTKGRS